MLTASYQGDHSGIILWLVMLAFYDCMGSSLQCIGFHCGEQGLFLVVRADPRRWAQ